MGNSFRSCGFVLSWLRVCPHRRLDLVRGQIRAPCASSCAALRQVGRSREGTFARLSSGTLDRRPNRGSMSGRGEDGGEWASSSALVTTEWLAKQLEGGVGDTSIRVLDASWYMPQEGKKTREEFSSKRIPGAAFFDVDGVADRSSDLPHMLPSVEQFRTAAEQLGIEDNSSVVVYSSNGFLGSARAWWTFRCFGFKNIKVLDGGFEKWLKEKRPVEENKEPAMPRPGSLSQVQSLDTKLVRTLEEVKIIRDTQSELILDARPLARFQGSQPEPRPGVASGHIPHSVSTPSSQLSSPVDGTLRPPDELRKIFAAALGISVEDLVCASTREVDPSRGKPATPDPQRRPLVTSCGSGITAAILALGLHEIGFPDVPVYDGSWTEYGTSGEPVEA